MRGVAATAALGLIASATFADAAEIAPDGAKIYQRCAACHLPNGAGIPGAFPALAGRVDTAAAADAGRDYLVMTVAAGVMGEIHIDGAKYRGMMPAQAGLSDADIAAVLNYAASLQPKGAAAKSIEKAFTAEEVKDIRTRHEGATPASVHAIRPSDFGETNEAAVEAASNDGAEK